jgi:hypothetical protein
MLNVHGARQITEFTWRSKREGRGEKGSSRTTGVIAAGKDLRTGVRICEEILVHLSAFLVSLHFRVFDYASPVCYCRARAGARAGGAERGVPL